MELEPTWASPTFPWISATGYGPVRPVLATPSAPRKSTMIDQVFQASCPVIIKMHPRSPARRMVSDLMLLPATPMGR